MSKTIKVIVDTEKIEENGGEYDENYLYEDLNGASDNLPSCTYVIGYKIVKIKEQD